VILEKSKNKMFLGKIGSYDSALCKNMEQIYGLKTADHTPICGE